MIGAIIILTLLFTFFIALCAALAEYFIQQFKTKKTITWKRNKQQ